MRRLFLVFTTVALFFGTLGAAPTSRISRVEPPQWWVGMKTPLTLMLYGYQLTGATVTVNTPQITVTAVHNAQSPNYLFIDVAIDPALPAGEYTFLVTTSDGQRIALPYRLEARRSGSAQRQSFGPADALYLLIVDRFANGDPSNDSHPLAAEKGNRRKLGGRHGGDLQGLMDHLDYLAQLGVTCLWPIPLLWDNEPTYSYHGYACADFYRVDPRYGTNSLYKEVVEKAHEKGLKFIQDIVLNHCGTAHWWMKDLPFADWINTHATFTRTNGIMSTQSDPHASAYDLKNCVDGWFDTSMPDMNLQQPFLRQYLIQYMIWWVEYANLDGLRIDTFPYSPQDAVASCMEAVLREYPQLTIVGECWFNEAAPLAYWEGGKTQLCGAPLPKEEEEALSLDPHHGWKVRNANGYSSSLPMIMDFPLRERLTAFNHTQPLGSWGMDGMRALYESFAMDHLYVQPQNHLIFLSNHDTNRPAYLLEEDAAKMKNAYTLLLTQRGTPQLYYGDEIMLVSANGQLGHSEERRDFPGGWNGDKVNAFTGKGLSKDQAEVQQHVRKLLNWRKTQPVFCGGAMKHFYPPEGTNLYVYFRYNAQGDMVMVAINHSTEPVTLDWERYAECFPAHRPKPTFKDVLTGKIFTVGQIVKIQPMTSIVGEKI